MVAYHAAHFAIFARASMPDNKKGIKATLKKLLNVIKNGLYAHRSRLKQAAFVFLLKHLFQFQKTKVIPPFFGKITKTQNFFT